jgi:hypothetical protein
VGKAADYRAAVGEHVAIKVPAGKTVQIFTEHPPGNLVIDRTYLGIDRSADAIVVQVTLNEGRDTDAKRSFYRTLAEGLRERVGLRLEDLVVNLVEVKREKLVVRPRRGPARLTQTPCACHPSRERHDDTVCADLDRGG